MKATTTSRYVVGKFNNSQVHRLNKERQAAGMTMSDLAKASGVSLSMIKRIFLGISSPTITLYVKLATPLGIALVPTKRRK